MLMQMSRGLSMLGHLANPKHGRAWWRMRQRLDTSRAATKPKAEARDG
jgi:hypothetical protein